MPASSDKEYWRQRAIGYARDGKLEDLLKCAYEAKVLEESESWKVAAIRGFDFSGLSDRKLEKKIDQIWNGDSID
ncbi:ribosomal protein [Apiospora arundinis]